MPEPSPLLLEDTKQSEQDRMEFSMLVSPHSPPGLFPPCSFTLGPPASPVAQGAHHFLLSRSICPQILQAPPFPPGLRVLSQGLRSGEAGSLPALHPPSASDAEMPPVPPGLKQPRHPAARWLLHAAPLAAPEAAQHAPPPPEAGRAQEQQDPACFSPTNPCCLARACSRPLPLPVTTDTWPTAPASAHGSALALAPSMVLALTARPPSYRTFSFGFKIGPS